MAQGKLYDSINGELIVEVDYRLLDASHNNWWGELNLAEYIRISDGSYILELADGRRGRCILNRKLNKAISGLLPLHCFRFRGSSELK
ncbi:MAG: hypothetical protein FWF98_04515 [Dehalococcoidia bacterium]|jgi:hypothetical protein|nr:hypothetical protein [Dehalococcoidia bacterium]MCL2615744.1 hypothetical protein [Dehalococcoidia bacterium]